MITLYLTLALLLGAVGTGVFGYWKGYEVCAATDREKQLAAENERLAREAKNLQRTNTYAQQEIQKAIATEEKNATIIADLQRQIEDAKKTKPSGTDTCSIDDKWLRELDTIR